MLFIRLEHIILQVREECQDLGIHDIVLDIGVLGQHLDNLTDDLGLLLHGLLTQGFEVPEQTADLLVIGLEQHDGVRRHEPAFR